MRVDRTTDTIWLTRAPRVSVAPRGGAVWWRTLGVAAVAAALAAATVSAEPPLADADAQTTAARTGAKETARLPRWKGQDAATGPAASAEPGRPDALLDPRPAREEGRFALADALETGSLRLAAFTPRPAAVSDGWREGAFDAVAVIDGRTFGTPGGLRIRLADLDIPGSDEVCRTLDGRLESCATRAATQLELLTRSRTLACRYRPDGSTGEAVGTCRIGGSDLAERLIRAGYARRGSAAPRSAALSGAVGRS